MTPVTRVPWPGLPGDVLLVKHDEHSTPSYGGNKPRKLEFVIGHALERGTRTLVTTGGLGTNHGLATTILGREAGLATVLVLVPQPITEGVRRTLLLHAAYGARHVFGSNVGSAALQTLRVLAQTQLRGERPLLVPTGGSSARGDLGFVSAAFELAEQVRAGLCEEPSELFVAVGSGGSLAGLVPGLRLAGLKTRVTGVLATDILPPSPRRLARSARGTLRLLRSADASVPELAISKQDFVLATRQVGPGYGAATPAAEAAVRAAAQRGLVLETTYTGKCLAEIVARADERTLGPGPVMFWNSYNAVDVAARAPRAVTEADLPRSIQHLLAAAAAPV
jgi:D-cysteine desulfhydrase